MLQGCKIQHDHALHRCCKLAEQQKNETAPQSLFQAIEPRAPCLVPNFQASRSSPRPLPLARLRHFHAIHNTTRADNHRHLGTTHTHILGIATWLSFMYISRSCTSGISGVQVAENETTRDSFVASFPTRAAPLSLSWHDLRQDIGERILLVLSLLSVKNSSLV